MFNPKGYVTLVDFAKLPYQFILSPHNLWECLFTHILPNSEFYQASESLPIWLGEMWCLVCLLAKSLQSCPTLCNPMNYSPPGSSVHGILQARLLEQVAILAKALIAEISTSKRHLLQRWLSWINRLPATHLDKVSCPWLYCLETLVDLDNWPFESLVFTSLSHIPTYMFYIHQWRASPWNPRLPTLESNKSRIPSSFFL